jgi:hypothetical protein
MRSMIEQEEERDHWKDLAAQLGLPPEGELKPPSRPEVVREAKPEVRVEKGEVEERHLPEPVE